jgi:hypothetical protein
MSTMLALKPLVEQEANTKNHLDAEPWLKNNRPDLHKLYFSVN